MYLCDTDFNGTDGVNGGRFNTAQALAEHIKALWPQEANNAVPYVVFTGGEPLLQLDTELIATLHSEGFEVAVETNGTVPAPAGIDWLCVSPKGSNPLAITQGDELKLVFPRPMRHRSSFLTSPLATSFYSRWISVPSLKRVLPPTAQRPFRPPPRTAWPTHSGGCHCKRTKSQDSSNGAIC